MESISHPKETRMDIKIATLNVCLGLQAKKNLVKETILSENIDILCMQEAEISFNLDHNLLSFPGYLIETESNSQSSRVAFYDFNVSTTIEEEISKEGTQTLYRQQLH